MKNIITLLFAFIFVSGAWAQTEETPINYGNRITNGTVLLGGGFNFYNTSTSSNEDKGSFVSISFIGALSERFGIGVGIGYSSTNTKFGIDTGYEQEDKINIFTIAPAFTTFGKVHFGWLQPMVTIAAPIDFAKNSKDERITRFGGTLSAGLNIYISKKLALNGSLGFLSYSSAKVKDSDTSYDEFNFGFSASQLNLGLIFVLGGE